MALAATEAYIHKDHSSARTLRQWFTGSTRTFTSLSRTHLRSERWLLDEKVHNRHRDRRQCWHDARCGALGLRLNDLLFHVFLRRSRGLCRRACRRHCRRLWQRRAWRWLAAGVWLRERWTWRWLATSARVWLWERRARRRLAAWHWRGTSTRWRRRAARGRRSFARSWRRCCWSHGWRWCGLACRASRRRGRRDRWSNWRRRDLGRGVGRRRRRRPSSRLGWRSWRLLRRLSRRWRRRWCHWLLHW